MAEKIEVNAKILPAGETCIFVDFGEKIDMKINGYVQALKHILTEKPFDGLKELVPTYRSLSIYFDPLTVDLKALKQRLENELATISSSVEDVGSTEVHVPVFFGGEYGPDLSDVAEHTKLSEDEVIKRYCESKLYCLNISSLLGIISSLFLFFIIIKIKTIIKIEIYNNFIINFE